MEDMDLESVEIVFAQRLASGEPTTRSRALKALREWIIEQSKVKSFEESDMSRLCQGLHYVLWMQDKMLLQEELSDNICSFFSDFQTENERILFFKCLLTSLAYAWNNVDVWRMDKFLLHLRKVILSVFRHLASHKWKKQLRDLYMDTLKNVFFSFNARVADGLRFHVCCLVLDELDKAGGLTKKQATNMLQFFADILAEKRTNDYLFKTVIKEIFETILHSVSEEFAAKKDGQELPPAGIEFDYKGIGKMLFEIGQRPDMKSARRKQMYNLVKSFDIAAKGRDPLAFEIPVPAITLTSADIEKAAEALAAEQEKVKAERLEYRSSMKKHPATSTLVGEELVLEKRDFKTKKTPAELKQDELKNKLKKPIKKKPKKSVTPKKKAIEENDAVTKGKASKTITKRTQPKRASRRSK